MDPNSRVFLTVTSANPSTDTSPIQTQRSPTVPTARPLVPISNKVLHRFWAGGLGGDEKEAWKERAADLCQERTGSKIAASRTELLKFIEETMPKSVRLRMSLCPTQEHVNALEDHFNAKRMRERLSVESHALAHDDALEQEYSALETFGFGHSSMPDLLDQQLLEDYERHLEEEEAEAGLPETTRDSQLGSDKTPPPASQAIAIKAWLLSILNTDESAGDSAEGA